MMVNVFFLSFSVSKGHVEADVRVLGPQSTITAYWPTSQENISQNGGIAGHQNLSHSWTEIVSKASQRQDQAPSGRTRAVKDQTHFDAVFAPFSAWTLESTRSQFFCCCFFCCCFVSLSVKAVQSQALNRFILQLWSLGMDNRLFCLTHQATCLCQLCMQFPYFGLPCLGWSSKPSCHMEKHLWLFAKRNYTQTCK